MFAAVKSLFVGHSAPTGSRADTRVAPRVVLGVFITLVIATWFRFVPWAPRLFFGDDLFNYMLYHGDRFQSKWADLFFADSGQKFRFVFSGLMHGQIWLFGKNTTAYFAANVVIHAASSTVLALLVYRCCRNWTVALALSLMAAMSHLGVYEVTQATGQVESLGLLFCMLTVLAVFEWHSVSKIESEHRLQSSFKWISVLCAFLAFNSHERYIVLLPWLGLFFVLDRRAGTLWRRVTFVGICLLLIGTNFLIKRWIFHSNFFQGTGGQPLAIHFSSIATLSSEAILSIIGVNHGPQYLTGAEWSDFSLFVRAMSLIFAMTCLSLVALVIAKRRKEFDSRAEPAGWWICCAILIALLLLPAVLTIRMEQRWELGPYYLLLTIVASGFGVLLGRGKTAIAACALVLLAVSSFFIESRISRSLDIVSYLSVDRFAVAAKRAIIDPPTSSQEGELVFVADPGYCVGTLLDGGFFLVYGGKYRPVSCMSNVAQARADACRRHARLFEWSSPEALVEVLNACEPVQ
ncbi:hypothetical protein [Paraburkholderia caribensis]|uniref:hypothetical protein n=1 Tax=Paraburkholderia caribensis TaxID=75105 RepID=UPI0031D179FF